MSKKQLEQLFASKNAQGINEVIDQLVQDSVPLSDSKPMIGLIASSLSKLDNSSTLAVAEHAINKLRNRQLQFEEEDTTFKREMAEVLTAR